MYKSIEKPKLIFILHAPLETLHNRHSDSTENLEHKYSAVKKLINMSMYKTFDTSKESQSTIIDKMIAIIHENLND